MSEDMIGTWEGWVDVELKQVSSSIEQLARCAAKLEAAEGASGYMYLENDEERRIREYSARVLRELESAATAYAQALRKRIALDDLIRKRERETGSGCKGECPPDVSF